MMPLYVIAAGGILLFLLLLFEGQKNRRAAFISKTILSSVFVFTALMQPSSFTPYTDFLIAGLFLCLGGDICLALPGERIFKLGLASFLLGHVLYIVSFSRLVEFTNWTSPAGFLIAVPSAFIFIRLRPHLGRMFLPVFFYILVITVMVFGALAVFSRPGADFSGRAFILAGASSFYVSDVFVARDKFIRQAYFNRLIGLPLYYVGQFLLAFSPGLL